MAGEPHGGHNGPSSDAGERVALAKRRNDDDERVAAELFGRLLLSTNRDTHSTKRRPKERGGNRLNMGGMRGGSAVGGMDG